MKISALGTLRRFPIFIVALWLAYVILSQFANIPVAFVDLAEVVLGFSIIMTFSIKYKFCFLHLLCIIYAFLCTLAMWYEQFFGFGEYLTLSHIIAAIFGVAILFALVIQQTHNVECRDAKK